MRDECVHAITRAAGRILNAAELQNVEARVVQAMRSLAKEDPEAWQAKSSAERLQEGGARAAEEINAEAARSKRRIALVIAANQRVDQAITEFRTNGLDALGALNRVVAFDAKTKGSVLSIESRSRGIAADLLRQMLGTIEAADPKWFGLFENRSGVEAIMKELYGEDSGNAAAKKGAEEFHKVAEAARERFNRAGGDVGSLEDWGLPQHHSQSRVAAAGREKWVTDFLRWFKRDKYVNEDGSPMSDAQLNDFFSNAWTTIATGGANKLTPGQFRGNGMRANRGNEARQLHFKDAQSFLDYQRAYGERTPFQVIIGHIESLARDLALVETLGPNPDQLFRFFKDRAVQEAKLATPTKLGRIAARGISSENLYNVVAGRTLPVASKRLADSFDTLRNWLVGSRLGSSVITSFSDVGTLHLTGQLNNLPAMQLFRNDLAALNPANAMEKRMAQRAGLALNTLISSLNRFGEGELGRSFSSKLANATLRASGLNAWTEAHKRAFGVTMMSSIGSAVREHPTLGDLEAGDHRMLLSKGITADDWAVWRKSTLEDWGHGNATMLTPESIYRIPDAELEPMGNPTKLKEDAATKLLGAVLEESDVAVVEPGAKERAQMGANVQRGTWKGEIMRSFFQFKSFPLAMMGRHFARGMSLPSGTGRAAYLATLFASTTVLGMLSLQVNELLSGRDPRKMVGEGSLKNWAAAMLKGGSLGLYGDFLFSQQGQSERGFVSDLAGPVAGLVDDVDRLTRGNLLEWEQGKPTHVGAEAVRFLRSNLPGANLWYAKAALDHLIFHQLQEHFSPGYLARMRNRAEREFHQRYWWEPGQPLPTRTPDLSTTVED